jgi:hypothetical protein
MAFNLDNANNRIQEWGSDVESKLKARILDLGIRHRANSPSSRAAVNSLRTGFRKVSGLINRISYSIPRHMIFVHKGVGKGTPIEKVGQTNRIAKPWFNPVIDDKIEELADIVAEETGDAIINNLFIK